MISSAEFDTRRRLLGLSISETAVLCAVQERTVNRWIRGEFAIPDQAIDALDRLESDMGDAVDELVELATDKMETGPVVLRRYRTADDQARSPHAAGVPPGAHAMMIGWAADALRAEGIDVEIVWGEAD